MTSYENILIITDLDGTLIPRGSVISAANKRAIADFIAGGGRFAIATGRTPEAAAGYIGGIEVNAPSVFFNGSMLYDWSDSRVLATVPLACGGEAGARFPEFAARCLAEFPEACIEVYTADNCHIVSNPANDDPRLPHEYYKYTHTPLTALTDTEATPWLKFFVNDSSESLARLEKLATEYGMDSLATTFYSDTHYFEFVAKRASKGTMLEKIRELPEYAGYKIIALGDYLNDNEMLLTADCGIASGNAHELTQAAADYVGCRAEDDLIVWTLARMEELLADMP